MKDLAKLRRHVDEGKAQPEKSTPQPTVFLASTPLPANTTVPVIRKMTSFILSMSSTCSVELFLIACKVSPVLQVYWVTNTISHSIVYSTLKSSTLPGW